MAKKIIKYKLNPDGIVPSFVEEGGYVPFQDWLIGVSIDNPILENDAVSLETKEDLINYIEQIGTEFVHTALGTEEVTVTTSQQIADSIWSKFNKDN